MWVLEDNCKKMIGLVVKLWFGAAVLGKKAFCACDASTKAIHIAEIVHRLSKNWISVGIHTRKILW